MTIIDFYKKLSKILTDTREHFISQDDGERKLENLLDEANKHGLDVKVSKEILDPINLMRLDDENSYKPEEDGDYASDFSFGSDSSY
jgi:hypothetical protein